MPRIQLASFLVCVFVIGNSTHLLSISEDLLGSRGAPPGYYFRDYRKNSRNNFYRDRTPPPIYSCDKGCCVEYEFSEEEEYQAPSNIETYSE